VLAALKETTLFSLSNAQLLVLKLQSDACTKKTVAGAPDILNGICLALQRSQDKARVITEGIAVKANGRNHVVAKQTIRKNSAIRPRQARVLKVNTMKCTIDTQGVGQRLTALRTHPVPPYAEYCDGAVVLQRLKVRSEKNKVKTMCQGTKATTVTTIMVTCN
jgi:hypothetical protein